MYFLDIKRLIWIVDIGEEDEASPVAIHDDGGVI
jgi:hypothetical protein